MTGWKLGDARIHRVFEQSLEVPIALITTDRELIDLHLRTLPTGMFDPERETFELTFQSWIVEVDDKIIVIDPCNGNSRSRPTFPHFENLDIAWLERFAATGVKPEDVDTVFCTHLHCDHCGWNTRSEDGRWVPTFPNARYFFVRKEVNRWDPEVAGRLEDPEYNRYVFAESIEPILAAGLADIIEAPHRLSTSLTIESAPGHTPGHAMLRLESAGTIAYFTGDAFHHPVRIASPQLHMPGCDDLALAIATRHVLRERISTEGAWIIPAHFAAPHLGRVSMGANECFSFLPGGLEEVPV